MHERISVSFKNFFAFKIVAKSKIKGMQGGFGQILNPLLKNNFRIFPQFSHLGTIIHNQNCSDL